MTEESMQSGLPRRGKLAQRATTCFFRTDQMVQIRQMADEMDRPISYVIREAVDRMINAKVGR